MKTSTVLIHYGPPGAEKRQAWRMRVFNAKKSVAMKGGVVEALTAHRGETIGCAMSLMGVANKKAFPHPMLMLSFTKSTAHAIVRFYKRERKDARGQAIHGEVVKYGHPYGRLVDLNDTGELKELVRRYPEFVEREFVLRQPRDRKGDHARNRKREGKGNPRASRLAYVPRGALRRAVKANLVSEAVAKQLENVADQL